ncbi:MAG: hypothetical protein EOM66_06490 [Clostridia bacterium]|nr:hypothetical protein [Candidatus Pelethousia sp.]NCB31041.1 hypothetical protein [Clostridia bacterium]
MPCHHVLAPQPELGCYIIRDVHDGRPDGVLLALSDAEEAMVSAAAAILAVQGFACRLARMADKSLFAAQSQAYQASVLPPDVRFLSPEPGETPAQLASRMAAQLRGK